MRTSDAAAKNILIGGIGNVLLGDDGVGPYLAQLLDAGYEFETGVEVADLGTPALDLIDRISAKDLVILIDCVDTGEAPGTVSLYHKEEIMRQQPAVRMDPHSPALMDALFSAELFGVAPKDLLLIGVAFGSFESGCSLSEPVRASCNRAIDLILSELDHFGVAYRRREYPSTVAVWWNAEATMASALAR